MRERRIQLELEEVRLSPEQEWTNEPNQWRFILLQSGTTYWLEAARPRELGPGELLILSPESQGVVRASQLGEAILHWFGFRPDTLLGFLSLVEREWIENRAAQAMGPVSCLSSTHPITQEMAALRDTAHADCRPVERAKALVLALRLLTQSMPSRTAKSWDGGARERFEEIIARMPDAEFIQHSSQELARLCGCTSRHFNRLFRIRFGVPTRLRQTELRLLKAQQLLETSTEPVAQIAANCGYRTLSLFNSLFRRRFGVSPSEWRDRIAL
jgi:AraC-like DNA-binding protein